MNPGQYYGGPDLRLGRALDRLVLNVRKQSKSKSTVFLDFDVPATDESPDEVFHREWSADFFAWPSKTSVRNGKGSDFRCSRSTI
jgi:hypothetical protein